MKRFEPGKESRRRTFLQCALALGGTAGLLGLGARLKVPVPSPALPKDADTGSARYRLTEHVRQYYEKAGF